MLEARTKEGRKEMRKQMGSLRSLTVQPVTKARYQDALNLFFTYLRREALELPKKKDQLDDVVSDYLEYLWGEGEGRATASTFLAALQDFDPKLRGKLQGSWRLMRTWNANELPSRAPPMTESVLKAMVGWAIFHEEYGFALSLLVGFYALLRTGELLALQGWQVHMHSPSDPAVLNLGLTKSGKRQGAAESVTLTELPVLRWLWQWKLNHPPHAYLTSKPHVWRQIFNTCLEKLRLTPWDFKPYSLRRGGATFYFMKLGQLDRILIMGRWTAVKTAKIYINTGLSLLNDIQIPNSLLKPFHTVFSTFIRTTPKLEQTREPSRPGGRGIGVKSPKTGVKKTIKKVKKSKNEKSECWVSKFAELIPLFIFQWVQCIRGPGLPRFGGDLGDARLKCYFPAWRESNIFKTFGWTRVRLPFGLVFWSVFSNYLILTELGLQWKEKRLWSECLFHRSTGVNMNPLESFSDLSFGFSSPSPPPLFSPLPPCPKGDPLS